MKPRNVNELVTHQLLKEISLDLLIDMYKGGIHVADGAALMATAIGEVLGEMQVKYEMHAENCDVCSRRKPAFHDTFIRDFTAAFSEAFHKSDKERTAGVEAADNFLESILKGHKA